MLDLRVTHDRLVDGRRNTSVAVQADRILAVTQGLQAPARASVDAQDQLLTYLDFKFAGIDVSTNKLVIGQRDASGWKVLKQTPFQLARPGA